MFYLPQGHSRGHICGIFSNIGAPGGVITPLESTGEPKVGKQALWIWTFSFTGSLFTNLDS